MDKSNKICNIVLYIQWFIMVMMVIYIYYLGYSTARTLLYERSSDGSCRIRISQTDFSILFEAEELSIFLKHGGEVKVYQIPVRNSGRNLTLKNVELQWFDKYAKVTVFGSEQEPVAYRIYWEDMLSSQGD